MKFIDHIVAPADITSPTRLDRFLLNAFQQKSPELSRSRLQSLIEQGFLSRDTSTIKDCSEKITPGHYLLTIPDSTPSTISAKDIPVEIIFEDNDVIVINKPAGLSVHPGAGNTTHTLVNSLLHSHAGKLSGIGGIERPGIVHRLDKDTSGLMVIAKNDAAHHKLAAQFSNRTLSRTYVAFVFGLLKEKQGTITTNIGRHPKDRQKMAVIKSTLHGKIAITHYKTTETFALSAHKIVSIVECILETGRTHQIRVHMQHLGHPLLGDPVYGLKNIPPSWPEWIRLFPRQALHAKSLKFIHPSTNEAMIFHASLPQDMEILLENLRNDKKS